MVMIEPFSFHSGFSGMLGSCTAIEMGFGCKAIHSVSCDKEDTGQLAPKDYSREMKALLTG